MRINGDGGLFEIERAIVSIPRGEKVQYVGARIWLHYIDEGDDWNNITLYPEDVIDLWGVLDEQFDDLEVCRRDDVGTTKLRVTKYGEFELVNRRPHEGVTQDVKVCLDDKYEVPLVVSWLENLIDRYVEDEVRLPPLQEHLTSAQMAVKDWKD